MGHMESIGGKRSSALKPKDKTMKTYKLLPMGFLALALTGTGALVATAQTTPTAPEAPAAQNPIERAEMRGDRDGHRGDRGGHRHHRAFGGKGGSEMFHTLFTEVDADNDRSVTQAEVDSYRSTKMGEADTSGDSALSIDEFDTLYREFTRSRMVDTFQDFDADGDGVVSAEELDVRFDDIVERMDRDGDGALTLQDRGRRG